MCENRESRASFGFGKDKSGKKVLSLVIILELLVILFVLVI